jgi:hypothetical protein
MEVKKEIIFEYRHYKKIELRDILKLNKYYFNKLIHKMKEKLGAIDGQLLNPEQVKIIVQCTSIPYKVWLE